MKNSFVKIITFLAFFLIGVSSKAFFFQEADITQKSSIIADGATPQLISRQFIFTEGPAPDKEGNVFFTDQPNDKIWKYSTGGKLSLFSDKTGRSNGLYFDKKGNIISCADERNELWLINPKGKAKVLVSDYKGNLLNGPNDLWVDPKGGIYITDPLYKRDYWKRTGTRVKGENVYYLPKNKKHLILVDSSLKQPNGIIGTPDGKTLYVADIKDNKTYKFQVNKDGTLQQRTLFTTQGSDGMTIDNMGNVYLSGKGVTVYDSDGKKIAHIDIPEKWTGNVCFGGKQKDKLFITASEAIYILDMNVKGVE